MMKNVIAAAMIAIVLVLAFVSTIASPTLAQPTAALDSASVDGCNGCTTLTTNLYATAGDVVVVQTELNPVKNEYVNGIFEGFAKGGPYPYMDSITAPNLQFHLRFASRFNGSSNDNIWMWEDYAVATTTGTQAIAVTMSTYWAGSVVAYSVSGINTTSPWDPNPHLPSGYNPPFYAGGVALDFNDCNPTDGCHVAYSTTNTNDFVVAGIGSQGNPTPTAPAGYTLIGTGQGPGWTQGSVAYIITSLPQTNTLPGSWTSIAESAIWYDDALQIASPSSSTSTTSSTSSTTVTPTSTSITSTTSASTTITSSTTNTVSTSSASSTTATSSTTSTAQQSTTITETCQLVVTESGGQIVAEQITSCF